MTQTQPPAGPNPYQGPPPPYQGGSVPYQGGPPPGGIPQQGGPPPAGLGYRDGYPGGTPSGYPQPPRRTNTLAIVSLVLAFLLAPVGLILGIVALVQIRKRGEDGTGLAVAGVVVGAIGTLIVAGIVLLVALAPPTLDTTRLESQISDTTRQEVGTAPSSVQCPTSIEIQPGATFTCTATLDGQSLPFTLTQRDDQGNVDYRSTGWTVSAKAEKALTDLATQNFPATKWTAACADGKKVVVGGPGTTFGCTLSVAGNPAQSEQRTFRITNDAGDVTLVG